MVKILLVLFLLVPSLLWGANEKITEFTEQSTVVGTDIFPMVNDPGSTPVTKKMTINTLHKNPSFNNSNSSGAQINLLEDSDNGTDYSYIKGADDAGTFPSFTFSGSQGSEDLTLTATANTWTFGTSTGVTSVGFGALNLVTTGTITGRIDTVGTFSSPITDNPYSLTAVNGSMIFYGATGEIDLPAGADGMNFCVYNTGAFTITIDPNASEVIVREGTAQTGGVSMTLSSGAGNFVCFINDGTNWITLGSKGTLAAGS